MEIFADALILFVILAILTIVIMSIISIILSNKYNGCKNKYDITIIKYYHVIFVTNIILTIAYCYINALHSMLFNQATSRDSCVKAGGGKGSFHFS